MLRELPITLDISKVGDQRTITGIRQYETDTVKFKISLVNGSIPFEINTLDNALIIMFGLKPDGKIIVNYAEINDNKIEYTLKEQDTTAAGVVKWQVCINEVSGGESCIFATPQFSTTVDSAVIDNDELESNDSVEALFEAINSIGAFLANNNLVSKYSFMFDGHGRIFSYTWDTNIDANSFAKYNNYNTKIAENHHVWLSSNVTNVQNGALCSVSTITKIICEAPQNRIALNEYSECDTMYGANSLSQFYILASLSSLLAEKNDTPINYNDCSSELKERIDRKLSRTNRSIASVESLSLIIYLYPELIHTLTLTGDAAQAFEVSSGAVVKLAVYGSWDTHLTRIITVLETSERWIQIVEGTALEHSFGTWTKINPVSDGGITYNKLASDTLAFINSKLSYEPIVKNNGGVAAGVDITYLNTLIFDRKTFYYVWFATNALFSGSPREWCIFFEIESGCQIAIRPNGDIYYREYSNAQWSDFKIKAQDDYSNNVADYSLGFDSKGVVKASANVTGLTTGISGCKSVYTAPKCTTLTSAFKSVNPSLTDIYVDNYAENMTIDTSITNDSNITIHYRGEFKLVDLLSNSQFRLNTRVTAVETLIGDIEDLIDTELNLEEE